MSEVTHSAPEHVFINLHATYFRRNRFFSLVDFDRLRQFNPDLILTLIDDVHDCWYRIQEREKLHPRATNLRMRDLLLWRTVEVMAGEFFKNGLGVPNYVVAVKHPSIMAKRLIFEPERKRIYASFPISSTRANEEDMRSVDEFRMNLHSQFTVFDPLTIDERILSNAYANGEDGSGNVYLDNALRWPTGFSGDYEAMIPPEDKVDSFHVPAAQIAEAIKDIDRQIEARDFRLIEQSQAVAAFRPNFRRHFSRGVNAELQYASQTIGIPVHLTWNEDEDGVYGDSPFGAMGTSHKNLQDLIEALNT